MNGGARINLEDAWPISDEEGRGLTGYTFTVTNKCEDPVNYIIALESLESTKGLEYLNNNYVKLAIDDEIEKRYRSLDTIENVVLENDPETIRETKEVTTATVEGNSINEHTIRIWLSEDAPLTEQNKVFTSRVRITGGQGVENTNVPATADSCFEIDENGEILGYDESCGESVVIPAKVNGTPVKTIDTNAFKEKVTSNKFYDENSQELTEKPDLSSVNIVYVANCDSLEDFDSSKMLYAISYTDDEEINNALSQAAQGMGIEVYYASDNNVPELLENQLKIHQKIKVSGDGELIATEKIISGEYVSITDLDLSKAIYLEKIETLAFSNATSDVTSDTDPTTIIPSLTSLTFGNNTNDIELERLAFTGIDVKELTIYTSQHSTPSTDGAFEEETAYTLAKVEDFYYKSTPEQPLPKNSQIGLGEFYMPVTSGIIANSVKIDPAITHLISAFWNAQIGTFYANEECTVNSTEYSCGIDILTKSIKELVLPEGVTSIGERAFASAPIAKVKIPASVETIGARAFRESYDKQTIKDLVFEDTAENPSHLKVIGENAFEGLGDSDITIPSSVQTIEKSAFIHNAIQYLTIEDSVTEPSQLTTIGAYAFQKSGYISATIPLSVTNIGNGAFYGASGTIIFKGRTDLTGLTLGDSWNGGATITYQQ